MSTMDDAGAARAAVAGLAGTAWWVLLVLGIITLVTGGLVLAWPGVTLVVLAVLFGVWLVVAGILRLVVAAMGKDLGTGWRAFHAVIGVLLIGGGVAALGNLLASLGALVFLVGFWFIVDGIDDLVLAFSGLGERGRVWPAITGLIGVAAGVLVLSRPGVGLVTLVLVVGVSLVVLGIARVAAAFALRGVAKELGTGAPA